ncbi:hypothetical protein [Enterococcus sp. CWB-B31]|uniref:hypothetical protein n=1 Tax=Enterococcus sp. CWB-B31 TaxID=2885159 RepID=UPI001E60ADF2|nr:hypothetical protein [Enterococcus sp. CWB-B31]MCB5954590.1 hypothetical protein [Enterococcus sp. CWB-B31]
MIRLKKKSKKKDKSANDFSPTDINSWVEESPIKRIMKNKQEYVELKEYGYLQLLEIQGKDLNSLGQAEVQRTLLNFHDWVTQFTSDWTIYTTNLPTNTEEQIAYQKRCLNECRKEMRECRDRRKYNQLLDREKILLSAIQTEEQIKKEIYNGEFILFLFAPSVKELDEVVRKARSYGSGEFFPEQITREKKIQILKQYNNMNDKLQ